MMAKGMRFEREAGFMSKVKASLLATVKDCNPQHRETKKGNECYLFVLRTEIEGQTWRGTLSFTRDGSRFDGMSESETDIAKQTEKLMRVDPSVLEAVLKAQGK
jgi:hypothetical protein